MNDQGLFFDTLALELMLEPPQTDLPDVRENVLSVLMSTCADVPCVVDYFNQHDRTLLVSAQIFFGDSSGDAVIVEPIEMICKTGSFLVSTNFLQSATPPSEITCERFKTAQSMLTEANGEFSVILFRQILDATTRRAILRSSHSNVYDPAVAVVVMRIP